ncbi:MAG: hypothetical protein Q8O40_00275, partial [Chloroflexota bacterium]|nr:hypothetical protein [Chloroflexota bacterium]
EATPTAFDQPGVLSCDHAPIEVPGGVPREHLDCRECRWVDQQVDSRENRTKEAPMSRIKVVLDIGEKDCMVGVGQEGCDPQTATIAFGEEHGLPVVLASAVRVVETAQARWKEAKRNPAYKPAPPPKPVVKEPEKGKDLPLLEEKGPAAAPEGVAATATPAETSAPSTPAAEVLAPSVIPSAPEIAPASEPGPGSIEYAAAAEGKVVTENVVTENVTDKVASPEKRGDWEYFLQNTGKPELDGKGPYYSTLDALDALGVPQEGRGKFYHRHDRLPKKYANQLDRRPKS